MIMWRKNKTGIEQLQSIRKKEKKLPDLDRYLIFCIVFFVLYTIAELTLSTISGFNHDTLTEAVKWFCCGEAFLCALIKRLKLKRGDGVHE